MTILDFFLIVAALSLAGVAIALVPALVQLKRTAQKTELFIDTLNREISPLLRSLSQTAGELQSLTASMNEKMDKVDAVMDTVEDTGHILRNTAAMIKQTIVPIATEIGGFGTGVRAFMHFFTRPGKNYDRR